MAASGSNFAFFSFVFISFFQGVKSFWIFDITSTIGYVYIALFCLGCLVFGVAAIVVIVCMIQQNGNKRRVTNAPAPSTIVAPGYYAQTVSGPSTVGAPGTYQMTPFIAPGYGYKTGHPQLPMGYQNHGGPPPSYAQPTGAQATPGAPPMEAQPGNQSASNELPPSYATTIGPNSVAPTVIQPAPVGSNN